jgi:hypothetical protein
MCLTFDVVIQELSALLVLESLLLSQRMRVNTLQSTLDL